MDPGGRVSATICTSTAAAFCDISFVACACIDAQKTMLYKDFIWQAIEVEVALRNKLVQ